MFSLTKKKLGSAKVFRLGINKYVYAVVLTALVLAGAAYLYIRFVIPTERAVENSRLVRLGDLNEDDSWDASDQAKLSQIVAAPWDYSDERLDGVDLNRNQSIDDEDLLLLRELYSTGNPHQLTSRTLAPAPKARELFRYSLVDEFIHRPTYLLQHQALDDGPLAYLSETRVSRFASPYLERLAREIYDEAMRFSLIYARREDQLSSEEAAFVRHELEAIEKLYAEQNFYDVLLHLILLSEAGETLSTGGQAEFVKNVRLLAQEFRRYLLSPRYAEFLAGEISWQDVFGDLDEMSEGLTGINLGLTALEPARDLTEIKNYIDRTEWQLYKSTTRGIDFRDLIQFAQNDRRYLRAVSNTSERHSDIALENHNLPMMLLFSEAMEIAGGDKKSAVGLLDEAIRVPFFWMKSVPDKLRPSSVALEHFLLPGNMEDGSDKSRHWNVFGGLALYRTPEESFTLAFQREVEDVRGAGYTPEAMTEFIRDMIANFYGIYHVVSYESLR